MNLFVLFVLLNILNVILSTLKSIATIKGGKGLAALMNAVSYGVYTIVVIYMVSDLTLFTKFAVVFCTNLVGVYVVKWLEEKARKDRLWKIEVTLPVDKRTNFKAALQAEHLSNNYVDCGKWAIFNIYCETQEQSKIAKEIISDYNAKYFVGESKVL